MQTFHSIFTNVVVLTMMISLQSQIKSQIAFQHVIPQAFIELTNKNLHSIHRENILMPSSKVDLDHIPLTPPFHPSIYLLHRIIPKHYKALMTNQDTKDIFKLLPITSYKREHNLFNHLVCASEPQPPVLLNAGTYPCRVLKDLLICQKHLPVFLRTLCMPLYLNDFISSIYRLNRSPIS